MKALILAAGRGRRLWPYTVDRPKCLLHLDGASILDHQLQQLEQIPVSEVVLICGFGIDKVRAAVATYSGHLCIKTLYNPFYAVSDNLISLWTARAEMDDDLLLLNGDGVFHPGIFQCLAAAEETCCLMVARKPAYDTDDMKVEIRQNRIVRIGKDLAPEETDAESIGAMRFSGEGVYRLRQALAEIVIEPQALRSYFLEVIQHLAASGHPPTYRETEGLPWADVDTPEDLRFVRHSFHLFQDALSLYGVRREI